MAVPASRAALYARVSTLDQEPDNQLRELQHFADARGWQSRAFVDRGVSGKKEKRPALDALLADARRRHVDVVVCWRLDRLGRSLKHLVLVLDELQALGVAFVSLAEGIDCTTPAGKLQMHILAAIAEFERGRIVERVRAGLARAKSQGRVLGRPARSVTADDLARTAALSVRQAAAALGLPATVVHRARKRSEIPAA
jgi:DNA invertase Pin-like site-specific DNA recombinase